MNGLFEERKIRLLAPLGIRDCRKRLVAAASSDADVGIANGEPIRIFVRPRGTRLGSRFFIDGTCRLVDRNTATEIDLRVGLSNSQRIAYVIGAPFLASVVALFAWMLVGQRYEPVALIVVIALFAGYVVVLALVVLSQVSETRKLITDDALVFRRFIERNLQAVTLPEPS